MSLPHFLHREINGFIREPLREVGMDCSIVGTTLGSFFWAKMGMCRSLFLHLSGLEPFKPIPPIFFSSTGSLFWIFQTGFHLCNPPIALVGL